MCICPKKYVSFSFSFLKVCYKVLVQKNLQSYTKLEMFKSTLK
jgi:hypothetical protein